LKEEISRAELEEGLKSIREALKVGSFTHGVKRKLQGMKTQVRALLNVSIDNELVKSSQVRSIRIAFGKCKNVVENQQ